MEATNQPTEQSAGDLEAVEVVESKVGEELRVDSMTVPDLKEELAKRGLATSGRKADLATRLHSALQVSLPSS